MAMGGRVICGHAAPISDKLADEIYADDENGMNWCCAGAAMNGPRGCMCWEPEYSVRRRKPNGEADMKIRTTQCDDCAYRHDSAEWQDEYDREKLESHVHGDGEFACHQGMPYIVRWRHPSGMVVEQPLDEKGVVAAYAPRWIGATPFKASGRPADVCAGYATRVKLRSA